MGSRLTFHEKAGDVCWQKQLRDHFLTEGTPPVPHLDVTRARVRPVSRKLAKQIVLKYEWLGTMASGVNRFYGIFYGLYCAGVTTFAPAGFNLPSTAKTFRVDGGRLAYLGRGACVHWAPANTNSKLISFSLRHEARLGNKIAVAFADEDAGEIGTIYQSCNWVYIGKGSKWTQWISPAGKIWSFNQFTKSAKDRKLTTGEFRAMLLSENWHEQKTNPKHRYVMVLDRKDKQLMALVESMRQPYPKRTPTGGASEPTEAGGSMPTRPLQESVKVA